jgi:hypothetical protein
MVRRTFINIVVILALLLGIAGSLGVSPTKVEAHTGYYQRTIQYADQHVYFPNFFVNPGITHWTQQTSPNKNCRHRFWDVESGQLLASALLNATASATVGNTMGFKNYTGYTLYVSHEVYCQTSFAYGTVQVYYWHG